MTRRDSGFDREVVATTTTKGQDNMADMDKHKTFDSMQEETVEWLSKLCGCEVDAIAEKIHAEAAQEINA